jgi:uncharacterized membrane protein YhaH (DUF805 family)
MRLDKLLFSFTGRIGRQVWWLTSLAIAFIAGMASSLVELAAKVTGNGAIDPESDEFEPSAPFFAVILAIGLCNAWINYALCAKRLHDRERTAWWLLAQAVALTGTIGLVFAALAMPEADRRPWFVAAGAFGVVAFGLSIWLFIELGFLKGTAGQNRFGPDPLGKTLKDAKL